MITSEATSIRTVTDEQTISRPALVSIVVPVYNESANVRVLADAIEQVMVGEQYELLFVNDGSGDDTLVHLQQLADRNPQVKAISLSRNFGHQSALLAGLATASGDAVITMDGDMQHPPALISELLRQWRAGAKVVHTRREYDTEVPWFKTITSTNFYRLFSWLCGVPIEPGMADFRLMDRQVVEVINQMQDRFPFLRALVVWMGYRSAIVPFTAGKRYSGSTKYTLRKMIRLATDGLISFSTIPLRASLTIGFLMALLSIVELALVCVAWLAGQTVPGWASMVGFVALLFSVVFGVLGIQGHYLMRLYERASGRPAFLIEDVICHSDSGTSSSTKE